MTYRQEILNRLREEFPSATVELCPQFEENFTLREQVYLSGEPLPVFVAMRDVNNLVDWYGAKALSAIAAGMVLELHSYCSSVGHQTNNKFHHGQ